MSMGNMSILLSVYPYYSVLVSDTFLDDATYSFRVLFYMTQQGRRKNFCLEKLLKGKFIDEL